MPQIVNELRFGNAILSANLHRRKRFFFYQLVYGLGADPQDLRDLGDGKRRRIAAQFFFVFFFRHIVKNKTGEVSSCDVPFSADLAQFSADYLQLTRTVAESCENHDLPGSMVIGTSAIVDTEIDGAVGMNSGIFNNPFIIWGKYHKGLFRTTLKFSLQFHHTQMDGAHAGRFLERLQEHMNRINTL